MARLMTVVIILAVVASVCVCAVPGRKKTRQTYSTPTASYQGDNSNGGNQWANPNGGSSGISLGNANTGNFNSGPVANGDIANSFNNQSISNHQDKYETNSDYNNYGTNSYYGNQGTVSNAGNHGTSINSGPHGRPAGPNDSRQDLTAAARQELALTLQALMAARQELAAQQALTAARKDTTVTSGTYGRLSPLG